jgi:hypothetical protein
VTNKVEALMWDYYKDFPKVPDNYIDSEAKIIIRVQPDLFWSIMIQRWNRNPVAFRENQWLAFLLAKNAFRTLKEFQPAFPERRAEFEKLLSELPHKPGRRTTDPDGVTVGTKAEEALLMLNDIRRERGEDRLTWTQVAPSFSPTPPPPDGSVPDPSGLDPNAEIEPLVAIGPLPQPLASPPDAGSGVNPEGGLPDHKSGSGKVVVVMVAIPVDELKE